MTRPLASLAELGVTPHHGPQWAADDIEDALWGPGVIGRDDTRPNAASIGATIQKAADELTHQISQVMPPGLDLVDDHVWGPADTNRAALARDAVHYKERAPFAEIVAATGLWTPPDTTIYLRVRIEGRRDIIATSGEAVSVLATRHDAPHWGVYALDVDGLADWHADFADLTDARRHAARWQRPAALAYTDHTEELTPTHPRHPGRPGADHRPGNSQVSRHHR